ncbi:hypothetical protein DBR40_19885 [Pedobacter sp. KBW01]|uniref:hypothetical protein n=1 Tax=Pedobacter sp. KBW01 TaxID=2153364 RepID=UPI000F5950FE|nr:hypothetical protein [Pedobacter sp. KBW01]RQO68504.1 hypothetical protein DBR40_19885 [Pedobacter sp. KBW01]
MSKIIRKMLFTIDLQDGVDVYDVSLLALGDLPSLVNDFLGFGFIYRNGLEYDDKYLFYDKDINKFFPENFLFNGLPFPTIELLSTSAENHRFLTGKRGSFSDGKGGLSKMFYDLSASLSTKFKVPSVDAAGYDVVSIWGFFQVSDDFIEDNKSLVYLHKL